MEVGSAYVALQLRRTNNLDGPLAELPWPDLWGFEQSGFKFGLFFHRWTYESRVTDFAEQF